MLLTPTTHVTLPPPSPLLVSLVADLHNSRQNRKQEQLWRSHIYISSPSLSERLVKILLLLRVILHVLGSLNDRAEQTKALKMLRIRGWEN